MCILLFLNTDVSILFEHVVGAYCKSGISARVLFSRIALIDIFATQKNCN